ncbi:hypothetical protein Tco_0039427 [Tanacetum coccineum]
MLPTAGHPVTTGHRHLLRPTTAGKLFRRSFPVNPKNDSREPIYPTRYVTLLHALFFLPPLSPAVAPPLPRHHNQHHHHNHTPPRVAFDLLRDALSAIFGLSELKVLPWKGVICFEKKGKLAPRYIEPFEILERIGSIVYRLRLPEELNSVHDTFHVSNLEKKCLADANLHVSLDEIEADKTLRFVEE